MNRLLREIHNRRLCLLLILILLTSLCCYTPSQYHGDGIFRDEAWVSTSRFHVDLGEIDLRQVGKKEFKLKGLPPVGMHIGFDITRKIHHTDNLDLYEEKPLTAMVLVTMTDNTGGVVIKEQASLKDWTWSASLTEPDRSWVYRGGKMREIKLPDGGSNYVSTQELIDHGFGSSFNAKTNIEYHLTLTVTSTDLAADAYHVKLLVTG